MRTAILGALTAATLALSAHAQVVISEVYTNPPGGGSVDDRWEYIEIYGPAGMSLSGYMVATVYGGGDPNANNIPGPLPSGWDAGDEVAEIDESWTLDGQTIGANGLFVLYNNNGQPSFVPPMFAVGTTSATFAATHIPTTDVPGRIKNDGSATFVLLRKRPFHTLSAQGTSIYDGVPAASLPSGTSFPTSNQYAWRKDINPDVNYDGRVDFNGLGTLLLGGPNPPEPSVNSERAATPAVGNPKSLEPYQMVDDISWSNAGGKEYVRSAQQKISSTDAFNPDAATRVKYYAHNPHRGSRFTGGVMVDTHTADEEFIYGDILDTGPQGQPLVSYNAQAAGGPTDQSGQRYNALGQPDAAGTYLLSPINLTGFKLTPGSFNDVDSSTSGGIAITQQRFIVGDFNFDGIVNCDDDNLITAAMGESLDAMIADINSNGTPATNDDFSYSAWKYQGRDFNTLLAMVRISLADTTTGEWNSGVTVTLSDLAAFHAIFTCPPACGTSDYDGDGDSGTDADIEAFFACLGGNCCATCFPGGSDFNLDGDAGTDADIESFFRVLGGGPC